MAKSVLVVDDQASFRKLVAAVLRSHGFDVTVAANGLEALRTIQTNPTDIVLLDLRMPVMDGLTALTRLRAIPAFAQLPVIVMSAARDRPHVVRAASLGISGYVIKTGFSTQVLIDRVTQTLHDVKAQIAAGHASDESSGTGRAQERDDPLTEPVPGRADFNGREALAAALHDPAQDSGMLSASRVLARVAPEISKSALMQRVNAIGELAAFTPAASHILESTSDAECSIAQATDAVGRDPTIALRVLKLANSSLHARGRPVETLRHAVGRIGVNGIRQAIMNFGVMEQYRSIDLGPAVRSPMFWKHSIACGLIASDLAGAVSEDKKEMAFTCGLLHDLGRLLLAQILGDRYVRVLETAAQLGCPLEQVESRMLGLTHADVMQRVLSMWRFPRLLIEPIRYHHLALNDIKRVDPGHVENVLRLGLADRLAHAMDLGDSGNGTLYPIEEHCAMLGVGAETIRALEESIPERTESMMEVFTISGSTCHSEPRTPEFASRVLYLSASPAIDAYRIACDQLGSPDASQSPNIAVVHIASKDERDSLGQQLLTAESEAGSGPLPILMLVRHPECVLKEDVLRARPRDVLTVPTARQRFAASIQGLLSRSAAAA